jgi:flagellar biosynthesis chaperone FliJ
MQKSERVVQKANADLNNASSALELSYRSLESIESPTKGSIQEMLASRTLLDFERKTIKHNQEWVEFTKKQVLFAKEQLKQDMIEYEKFKYLDLEEIKKIIKKQKIQETKDLDEIALMTHEKKGKK